MEARWADLASKEVSARLASMLLLLLEIEGVVTPEGHRQILAAFRSAFPNLHLTTEDVVAEGDKVVSRWTARGTHQGDLMGIAPTGNRVTIKGIDVLRTAEGRIVERWASLIT